MSRSSNRVSWIKPSAIRRMLDYSAGIDNLVHFEQGEPDFRTPEHIIDAAFKAAKGGCTHYTNADGTIELREAIAEKLRKENRVEADAKTEVTVTSGSQEAMLITVLAFLNQGDEILILDPYYPAYFEDPLIAEATPVTVPLDESKDYRIDDSQLEGKITENTKMIWLCNPSNPTGHVFPEKDLKTIAEIAQEHDLLVFSDEIYEKLVYDDAKHVSIGSLPGMKERTITANGFSKSYAMTGWRIGYVAANKKLSLSLRKMHYYATICPNSISQKAALAALTGPQDCLKKMLAEYDRRRKLVMIELDKLDLVKYTVPKGAFYVFPDMSQFDKSDENLALRLLKDAAVVTVPGSGFGVSGEGHLRISYSVSTAQIREGMTRIKKFFNSQD
jgi:aspartate/methionine/tyrosine aminotransferase